jgi:hypothetical protein
MPANESNPAKGHESSGETSEQQSVAEDTGISTTTAGVDVAFATVDLGEITDRDGEITTTAYAYDDETGGVELSISAPVGVKVTVTPDNARELARAIATAAEKAEGNL